MAHASPIRRHAWSLLRHVVLMGAAAVVLLPFIWMLSTSLKPQAEVFLSEIRWWPHRLAAAENYAKAFDKAPLARFLANGAIVTASIFLLQVLVALPAAYALAKLRFWGRQTVFALVLFSIRRPPRCPCSCSSTMSASSTRTRRSSCPSRSPCSASS
jgi:multiple sugar transport system permease protein